MRYEARLDLLGRVRDKGLRALASERRRCGYRRLLIFLPREGFAVDHKRLFRIYPEERLMVRKESRPQKGSWHAGTDASALGPERPLVPGFCL